MEPTSQRSLSLCVGRSDSITMRCAAASAAATPSNCFRSNWSCFSLVYRTFLFFPVRIVGGVALCRRCRLAYKRVRTTYPHIEGIAARQGGEKSSLVN